MTAPLPIKIQVRETIRAAIIASKSQTGLTGCVIGWNTQSLKLPFVRIIAGKETRKFDATQLINDWMPLTLWVIGKEEQIERAREYLGKLYLNRGLQPYLDLLALGAINVRVAMGDPPQQGRGKDDTEQMGSMMLTVVLQSNYLIGA